MSSLEINFGKYQRFIERNHLISEVGKVMDVVGPMVFGYLPGSSIGSICRIYTRNEKQSFLAEVVGFRDMKSMLMPLGEMRGIAIGSRIELVRATATVKVGDALLGRVVDARGKAIDKGGPLEGLAEESLYAETTNPLDRKPIDKPLDLGVRALNGLITVGKGQRVGIMAGSGVGKSVLLGQMAKNSSADVNVIALIGERGREVREFVESILGEEGLKRSVVVVATSDQSPLLRMRGAFIATTVAEYFSNQGKSVLLMMDSVTRFAMAQREVGLSVGEPPASKGYTPSVFALLPKLLERVGNFDDRGSITGLYTVLVEGDDMDDPIADSVRSIVDGHVVLDRKLAHKGHFPSIDVLQSTSRVMRAIVDSKHMECANEVRDLLSTYKENEDLINIGAYQRGSNPRIDRAIDVYEGINNFLKQGFDEVTTLEDTVQWLNGVVGRG